MDSSVSMRGGTSRVVPNEELDNHLNLKPRNVVLKSHPNGTTPSFSSSSSSCSFSFSSPFTPLQVSGVPFSWEKTPGIPKKLSPSQMKDEDEDEDEGSVDLPLPPLFSPPSSRRFSGHDDISLGKKVRFPGDDGAWYQWDPFVAALVECSKEEGYPYCNGDREKGSGLWNGRRFSRSIMDCFNSIALHSCSCKKASPTSDSIICLPRSSASSFIVTNGRSW